MRYMLIAMSILASAPAYAEPMDEISLSESEKKEAYMIGVVSGMAEACGLEWQPHFQAFMRNKRVQGRSEKEMGYIGVFHGVGQGGANSQLKDKCDAKTRKGVEAQLNMNMRQFKN